MALQLARNNGFFHFPEAAEVFRSLPRAFLIALNQSRRASRCFAFRLLGPALKNRFSVRRSHAASACNEIWRLVTVPPLAFAAL